MPEVEVSRLRANYRGPHELVATSDGATLFVRRWDSKGDARASVLIMHGITAYSSPYGPLVAEQLADAGYTVFGMDLRGHGLSDGRRGDYPSRDRFVRDLTETVSLAKSKSRKLILMGHSLGVLSAIAALNARGDDIDGLVLVSAARRIKTGVFAQPTTRALLRTLVGVAVLRGTPLIDYRRQGQLGLDDPLFNLRYSARFYSILYGVGALAVTRMMRSGLIDSPNLKFKQRLHAPLLVGIGDQDELFATDAAKEFPHVMVNPEPEVLVRVLGRTIEGTVVLDGRGIESLDPLLCTPITILIGSREARD
jgi:alpha-beta hydrolase superfamily lysophospholipase